MEQLQGLFLNVVDPKIVLLMPTTVMTVEAEMLVMNRNYIGTTPVLRSTTTSPR
jgi:hypothetical protein